MVEIKLHEVIDSESNAWIYDWMGMNRPFSLECLQEVLEQNPNKGIKLSIHCDGGNVEEGLAIYDALRTSGRKIKCNVEGKCHSMAIVMLLAAPKENRTANPNAQFLIHEVSGGVSGNISAMEKYVEEAKNLQNKILDIYADRTGYDRAELETIMKEEKMRDSKFMLDHGFLGSINDYNTNSNTKMNLLEGLKNLISKAESEGAEQNIAPQNNEQIEALNARIAEQEQTINANNEQMATLNNTIAEREATINAHVETINAREARIAELESQLQEAQNARTAEVEALNARVAELENSIKSGYQPSERDKTPSAGAQNNEQSREEQKNAIREALAKNKK